MQVPLDRWHCILLSYLETLSKARCLWVRLAVANVRIDSIRIATQR